MCVVFVCLSMYIFQCIGMCLYVCVCVCMRESTFILFYSPATGLFVSCAYNEVCVCVGGFGCPPAVM